MREHGTGGYRGGDPDDASAIDARRGEERARGDDQDDAQRAEKDVEAHHERRDGGRDRGRTEWRREQDPQRSVSSSRMSVSTRGVTSPRVWSSSIFPNGR
jgi:hypothetical protein